MTTSTAPIFEAFFSYLLQNNPQGTEEPSLKFSKVITEGDDLAKSVPKFCFADSDDLFERAENEKKNIR
jgi:hypothetical protein